MSIGNSHASVIQIFLAEDNPGDVRLIREALKLHKIEFNLHVFEDGEKASSFVGRLNESSSICPDLIFLDLNLPKTDGRDILRQIKQNPRVRGVPIIVLSSSESPQDRAEATSLGADRYVCKPSSLDQFMALGALARELVPHKS